MNILELNHIKKSFGEKEILKDISFSLNEGERVSLVGISGSGKSTIFNIISGTIMPDFGEVKVNGEIINGISGKVGYMLQDDLLLPHMNIEENVALPLILKGVKKNEALNEVRGKFKIFGLEGTEKQYPKELSGGMRQRAALFRTITQGLDILLLDEPFSKLDKMTKDNLHMRFLEISEANSITSLFITHDIEEAVFLSDRVLVLKDGIIKESLNIDEPHPRKHEFYFTEKFLNYHKKLSQYFILDY